jgi:hypothetical protein
VRNIFVKKLSILVLLLSLILISGCDGKKPDEGYISKEEVTANIVSKFETKSEYTKYAVSGNLNYFAYSEDKVYPTVNKLNQVFNDLVIETWECSHCGTVNEFVNANCTNKETKCIGSRPNYKFSCSYYLNLPLHISKDSWNVLTAEGKIDTKYSLNYLLEGRIHAPNSGYPEYIYYYERPEGGFILKAFGVNKALRIINPSDIVCHAKWNIVVEYDKNGYLVSELFETINAQKDPDTKTVYGFAKYTYEK